MRASAAKTTARNTTAHARFFAVQLVMTMNAWLGEVERRTQRFMTDIRAATGLGGSMAIVWTIVGAVVAITIAATLAPTLFTALGDLVAAMLAGGTNSTTGDLILGVMVIVVAIAVVVGFVGLVLRSTKLGGGKGF